MMAGPTLAGRGDGETRGDGEDASSEEIEEDSMVDGGGSGRAIARGCW